MKKSLFLLIAVALLLACSSADEQHLPYYHTADFTPIWLKSTASLDTLHQIEAFRFWNQQGKVVTEQTFKGKIHVANFFFTICPGLCPRLTKSMEELQTAFQNDPNVLLASYSVTPERDSVSVLRAYASRHGVRTNKWHLLTGDKTQIYQTARKSYFADENLGTKLDENNFLHTENFILVDQHLHIRGIYNGTLALDIKQLIEDIKVLERE
ncbi:MAG: SCO family protein [Spirosomataceae bacterium]